MLLLAQAPRAGQRLAQTAQVHYGHGKVKERYSELARQTAAAQRCVSDMTATQEKS
jgi:hypothetical protein